MIPKLLETFEPNNLVLNDCQVCKACNRFFGDQIEIWLGRSSFEALMRFQLGQSKLSKFSNYRGYRVNLRVPPGFPWEGARLKINADVASGILFVDLIPQIGVKRPSDQSFRFFTEEEFLAAPAEQIGIQRGSNHCILSPDTSIQERLILLAKSRVPRFRLEGQMQTPPSVDHDGQMTVEISAALNNALARAVAKIAFNYMTHVAGNRLTLGPSFSAIRRFIRHDEGPWGDFVSVNHKPILANDGAHYRITQGHLIVLEWRPQNDDIVVRFSPFNVLTYEIVLARSCRELWRPIDCGHCFDWESRKVSSLASSRFPPSPVFRLP